MAIVVDRIGSYGRYYGEDPPETESTWYHRAANMVSAYSTVSNGSTLQRENNPDEYFIWSFWVPLTIRTADETVEAPPGSVVIVPPGKSSVEAHGSGSLWRGFTSACEDLIKRCPNASEYEDRPPGLAPLDAWPMPPDGYKVRVYDLDTCAPMGKPRCFRHRTGMTNFGWPIPTQPRPDSALSPHTHADFEQFSLIYAGTMVHHMRRAWARDSTQWLPDEHEVLSAPAVVVSKPPDVHTTQAVTTSGEVGLIDFFAPPRWDFSNVNGMVINHAEYPMPSEKPQIYGVEQQTYAADDPRAALNRPTRT